MIIMTDQNLPRLRMVREFTDLDARNAQSRGYLSHVLADFGDGRLFPLFFYDMVRLQQDLEARIDQGSTFLADPGMIVVPEITWEAMELERPLSVAAQPRSQGTVRFVPSAEGKGSDHVHSRTDAGGENRDTALC
jgi:hypothetical protein